MSSQYLFLFISLYVSHFVSQNALSTNNGSIGINYGRIANNLPSPPQAIKLLKSQGFTRIKLYDADSAVLKALSGSGIHVTVALLNQELKSAAIGNEVFVDPQNTTSYLVPAMYNVYASLVKYDVASNIKVTSPIAISALGNSYPPSLGSFKSDLVEPVIKPMVKFLKQTGSGYENDILGLCFIPHNGLVYKSLLEAQIDAVYSTMGLLGFNDVKLVVSETGWPSKGDENEVGANKENAEGYNGNLVKRALTGGGTPLRPNEPINAYLFALFNENQKGGPSSEQNYGLFYPSEEKVYDIPLTIDGSKNELVPIWWSYMVYFGTCQFPTGY
ncbi:glucosidase [Lithospermum erythrorhizon]|uniref:Glucosidase n=1 Tax=Lithospermum erythrorhizon TaxID=34254 RepID=A0AAV3R0H8_LITER